MVRGAIVAEKRIFVGFAIRKKFFLSKSAILTRINKAQNSVGRHFAALAR
jgi:hypothetical protein